VSPSPPPRPQRSELASEVEDRAAGAVDGEGPQAPGSWLLGLSPTTVDSSTAALHAHADDRQPYQHRILPSPSSPNPAKACAISSARNTPLRVEVPATPRRLVALAQSRPWGPPIWSADEPRGVQAAPVLSPEVQLLAIVHGRNSG
jgi:hypothetical protein